MPGPPYQWPQRFPLRLNRLRKENFFTDIEITVDGFSFRAHKNLLVGASDYFLHMFTGSMVEASMQTICITGISAETFGTVLDCIYSLFCEFAIGKLVTNENVEDLMHAADMLQMHPLRSCLISHLVKNVDEGDVLAYYVMGWRYNVPELCEKASLSTNLPKMTEQEEFLHLDVECLKDMFSHPFLNSTYENHYCRAIINWFQWDITNREVFFAEVMALFCYHQVTDVDLLNSVNKLYTDRGRERLRDMSCVGNSRCPEPHVPLAQVYTEYGTDVINLNENPEMMNTFTCKYSYVCCRIPEKMLQLKVNHTSGKTTTLEQLFYQSGKIGKTNLELFHQGETSPQSMEEKCILVSGNSSYKHWGDSTIGIFSQLRNARLIIDAADDKHNNTANVRYLHHGDASLDIDKTWRYPFTLVIGGDKVDMDDAMRFACSLVLKSTGKCDFCKRNFFVPEGNPCRYIDIWSEGYEGNRASHFGYGGG